MNAYKKPILRLSFFTVLLVMITLFIGVNTTNAKDIFTGNSIPVGTTIDNEAVLIDDTILIDGTINGDVLVVGSNVNINGSINGSLIAIGDTIQINGKVSGTVYSASLTLELDESTSLERNLYYAGLSLITKDGSLIGRDLYALALGATFGGSIDRDTNAVIGPIEFIKLILGIVEDFQGQSQFIPQSNSNTSLSSFNQPEFMSAKANNQTAIVNHVLTDRLVSPQNNLNGSLFFQTTTPTTGIDVDKLQNWILDRLREFVTLLVFGLVAMWVFPTLFSNSTETIQLKALPAFGWGLLLLVLAFNIIALSFLLAGLIFMIGLWLGITTLWALAFAFWIIGISGLGLVTTLFTLFVIYVSKTLVAYAAAMLVLNPLIPRFTRFKVIPLLVGLIVFVLLHSISILGAVISILVTAFGLGIAWVTWRKTRTQNQNVQDDISPSLDTSTSSG